MTEVDRLNALMRSGLAQHLALAVVDGRMTEADARAAMALKTEAARILALGPAERPTPAVA